MPCHSVQATYRDKQAVTKVTNGNTTSVHSTHVGTGTLIHAESRWGEEPQVCRQIGSSRWEQESAPGRHLHSHTQREDKRRQTGKHWGKRWREGIREKQSQDPDRIVVFAFLRID